MVASLAARVRDSGYTPGIRDLGALLDLLADPDEELARETERAVLRIELRHGARLMSETVVRAGAATRPARGRFARLVGRLAANASAPAEAVDEARTWLRAALADPDPKTRHTAARSLGKLRPSDDRARADLETALCEAWDRGGEEDRKALAEALGKVGSAEARARLDGIATRATLMIDREASRAQPGAIDLTREMSAPLTIRFHARTGLEEVLLAELGDAWRPRVAGPGLVDARLEGPLAGAAAPRTALFFGIPLDPVPVQGELAEAVVRALTSPRALSILRAYTDGPVIRFRLAWVHGGHRRALAWRCAELVAAATKELVNDPTASTWEIVVDDHADRVAIELVPRGYVDDRFAYRTVTVPASSHPTIAAALARLVPPHPEDVVWDPFVGAGAELVERSRLGPYRALIGTDVEAAALEASRTNLAAAGITNATLSLADATTFGPKLAPTLIVTNPPMGRRVQRGSHGELLERFMAHAAPLLAPGGALVWAAPDPARLARAAKHAGLRQEKSFTVDMGGFPAELCVLRKT